jgi:hypothetical protein
MGNKFDPLEAAKQMPVKGRKLPPQSAVSPQPAPIPSVDDVAPKAAVIEAPVATVPERHPPRYRVVKGKQVSLRSGITYLPADSLISEGSYGPGIVDLLLSQGVELEALPNGG